MVAAATFATGLLLGIPATAQAQVSTAPQQGNNAQAAGTANAATGSVIRDNSDRGGRRQQSRRRAPAGPTAEEITAQARTIAQVAAPGCEVIEGKLLGESAEGHSYYEVSCSAGPGYIVASTTPPRASDCVLLAGQAQIARERDPAAEVGTQCTLPGNMDVLRVISAYAQQAGVSCTVDQGMVVGRSTANNEIYEIGCSGVQGYWIEKTASGWQSTECLQVITENATCRFTTPQDGAASLKAMLAGSEAADCDVTQARFMGENSNGRFYEAKCAAGNGVIARFQQAAVQQIYPCEEAQRIGGGCTLTQVAAAPATTEQN